MNCTGNYKGFNISGRRFALSIGFIGAGKCGVSLANYFLCNGMDVSGFYSRHNTCGDFKFLPLLDLVNSSEIIFITVSDSQITNVWNDISRLDLGDKMICHTSGSNTSDIFSGANEENVCSVHPMLAFNSQNVSVNTISKAFFTLEGGENAVLKISQILTNCGNKFKVINKEDKAKYHAAACFASNFVVSVCTVAEHLLKDCGFSETEAREALIPIMENNMSNIISVGTKDAITGPAARGDIETIKAHLAVLGKYTDLYKELTDVIFKMKGIETIWEKQ